MSVQLKEIWRYPVKSMAGETLSKAHVGLSGITGDRLVQLRNSRGRMITARTHPALLGHRGKLGPDGEPLIDGRPWDDAGVSEEMKKIGGSDARLVRDDGLYRFDILPLLVATDGAIAAAGYDRRRFRPNLVIEGVEGLEERKWPGHRLRIGEAVIGVQDLRARCVMTTYDPDSLVQSPNVLRRIVKEFDGKLALNCFVIADGVVEVGQKVELLD